MEDELENIYSLYDAIAPLDELSEEKASQILKALKKLIKGIYTKIHLLEVPFATHALPLVITRYQKSLYLLAHKIWEDLENFNSTNESTSRIGQLCLKNFSDELIELIKEISRFFPEAFDSLAPAPLLYLQNQTVLLNQNFKNLCSKAKTAEETELLAALKTTISYTSLKSAKAGLFHLQYLENLIAALDAVEENTTSRWTDLMIEYGFNAPAFYSYCCMEIVKKRDRCQDITESYGELYWEKKRLQQLVLWKGMPFYKALPGIKTSLLNFVEAEIGHLQSLEKIGGELAGNGQLNENFRVSFSVKELAYFIHLQVECGIILEQKPKKIHQYIIGHYSTEQTERISEKSFKNASYSRFANHVSKVITKLSEMLARAQDDL